MYIYKAGTGVGISVFGIWGDKVASILYKRHTVSKDVYRHTVSKDVYMAILAHIVMARSSKEYSGRSMKIRILLFRTVRFFSSHYHL